MFSSSLRSQHANIEALRCVQVSDRDRKMENLSLTHAFPPFDGTGKENVLVRMFQDGVNGATIQRLRPSRVNVSLNWRVMA